MDEKVRRARTEAVFRDVNERIVETATRFHAPITQFVCECSDPGYTHRLEVTLLEYEEVRASGATFLLAPGHEHADIERVVDERGPFQIVEEVHGTVRDTVRRLDPRGNAA